MKKTVKNSKTNGSFSLRVKYLDIKTGHPWIVIISEEDGRRLGIRPGDELTVRWKDKQTEIAVDTTKSLVKKGEIGLFRDITSHYKIKEGEWLKLKLAGHAPSLKIIHKKLNGEKLSGPEIYALVADMAKYRVNDLELAFFIASAFNQQNFSREEIYWLTKAISETGEMMKFGPTAADKHSIGGLPGNRVSPIIVSIVASYGITIPKTSSRAITSAAGTADTMEVLAPVGFSSAEIKEIVRKTNGCLIWGGALRLAPVDDRFIKITRQLGMEPYSKMVVSIMAKQVATGIRYLIIDMPIGPTAKISRAEDVRYVKNLFMYLAKKFKIKIKIVVHQAVGPIGCGIGPGLEARDVLRVLQQKENCPRDLEKKALGLAGGLLELTGRAHKGQGRKNAEQSLRSGNAWKKMQEIIKAQGGNPFLDSEEISLGKINYQLKAGHSGRVQSIHNKNLNKICRLLGAPLTKEAGVYLYKSVGEKVKKGETLCAFYTDSRQRLILAQHALKEAGLYNIK